MTDRQTSLAERIARRITYSNFASLPEKERIIMEELDREQPAESVACIYDTHGDGKCDRCFLNGGCIPNGGPVTAEPIADKSLAQIAFTASGDNNREWSDLWEHEQKSWSQISAAIESEVLKRAGVESILQQMIDVKIERDKAKSQDLGLRALIEQLAKDRDKWQKNFHTAMELNSQQLQRESAMSVENERLTKELGRKSASEHPLFGGWHNVKDDEQIAELKAENERLATDAVLREEELRRACETNDRLKKISDDWEASFALRVKEKGAVPACRDFNGAQISVGDIVIHIDGGFGGVVSETDGQWLRLNRETHQRRDSCHFRKVTTPEQPHWTAPLAEEQPLGPWSDIADVPLNAWFRHKSSTTCRKIEAFDGGRVRIRNDWLTIEELCDEYDYSDQGIVFRPCGKPAKGVDHAY